MPIAIFKGEFDTYQVPLPYDFQKPPIPRMQGNKLCEDKDGWRLEIIWVFPSGRKRYSGLVIPGNEGAARLTLSTVDFWKNMYETIIIDMQGSGEGLDVRMPGTRH